MPVEPFSSSLSNLDECIARTMNRELLSESLIRELCDKLKEILVNESNVKHIQAPVTVVGDVHGQFYDVLELFKVGGYCPDTNYLFLGDYVDRGHHSVETMTLLVCLKLRYPNRVTLIRGNHESRAITRSYGFLIECQKKYGSPTVWRYFTDLFDYLTLSVVIEDSLFCVHGGLSPSIQTLDQIRVLNRFQEIPPEGPFSDLMWSDPDPDRDEYAVSQRGAGYTFGKTVVERFLETNNMTHILRAHQLCMEGYQVLFDDKLSTVWSAPNYGYRCGNKATILEVNENLVRTFNFFEASVQSLQIDPNVPDVSRQIPDYFL